MNKKHFFNKYTISGILGLILLMGLISIGINKSNKKILREIDYYTKLIEKYPAESENYKNLSDLYKKKGESEKALYYYDLYQKYKEFEQNNNKQELADFIKKNKSNNQIPEKIVEKDEVDQKEKESEIRQKLLKELENNQKNQEDSNEKKALEEFKKGLNEYDNKNYSGAENYFKKSLEYKKDYGPSHAYLAATYLEKKNYEAALKSGREALALDQTQYVAHYTIGEVYRNLNDYSKAEEKYKDTLEYKSDHCYSLYRLANIYFINKQFEAAKNLYVQCIDCNPQIYKAFMNLSAALLQLKDYKNAKNILNTSLEHHKLQKDPSSLAIVYNYLGDISFYEKDYNNAIAYYRKSLANKQSYNTYLNIGIAYEKLDKVSSAIQYYKNSIKIKPTYKACHNLATIYFNQKEYNSAIEFYNKTIDLHPDNIDAYINLAKSYIEIGNEVEAKKILETALKHNYNNATAHLELARFWKNKGILDQAVKEAKLAIQFETELEEKLIHYNELGLIYQKFKIFNEAENAFINAKDINPGNITTLYNLADLYVDLNRLDETALMYETIIKINSKEFKAYYLLGKTLVKKGDNIKAKEILLELLKINPSYDSTGEINKLIESL